MQTLDRREFHCCGMAFTQRISHGIHRRDRNEREQSRKETHPPRWTYEGNALIHDTPPAWLGWTRAEAKIGKPHFQNDRLTRNHHEGGNERRRSAWRNMPH